MTCIEHWPCDAVKEMCSTAGIPLGHPQAMNAYEAECNVTFPVVMRGYRF
jgi:hypothetical protein